LEDSSKEAPAINGGLLKPPITAVTAIGVTVLVGEGEGAGASAVQVKLALEEGPMPTLFAPWTQNT
jgi:hypothetical protein